MNSLSFRRTLGTTLLYVTFIITLIYVFQGRISEKPTISVDHFQAGASGVGFLILPPLAIILSLIPLRFWAAPIGRVNTIMFGTAMVLPILALIFLFTGFERRAPQYDEIKYKNIVTAYEDGTIFHQDQVIELLGRPLSQEQLGGREVWSYTYMPSTGYG